MKRTVDLASGLDLFVRTSSVARMATRRWRGGVKAIAVVLLVGDGVVQPEADHDHQETRNRKHVEAVVQPCLGRRQGESGEKKKRRVRGGVMTGTP